MDAVKSFNSELSSLYEVKPPISKAKMTAITRGAIKAIKFYKHVVQSVEKFILKCKPEYKVPGLYVIDSIVRQSRHQFGSDKDVFAPRFAKNMRQTFVNLFVCPPEDKSKIIRVLNLWQKNQVFAPEVIQPLFDLADPKNPIHKELGTPLQSNGSTSAAGPAVVVKGSPALQKTPTKGSQQGIDGAHLGGTNLNITDPNVLAHLQQLQRLLSRSGDPSSKPDVPVHFDRKLLDFDYGDDDDEAHSSPKPAPPPGPNDSVASLLTNPEVLRQLQTLQQTMTANQNSEMDMDKMRKLQEMKQQEDEFDKHLAQTVPNLPFASECEFKPIVNSNVLGGGYYIPSEADLSQPPPGYVKPEYVKAEYVKAEYKPPLPLFDMQQNHQQPIDNDVQFVGGDSNNGQEVEIINLDHGDSRSPSPHDDKYGNSRRRRSRSRERSRDRRDKDRRSRRSRSRSKSRRHRSRSRERTRAKEKVTEKDKERKKRGLPTIRTNHLSVCSTTLWVGHLSKLVHQEDLSNVFGEFGEIVSIDLIPPRGCAFIVMHRRQDAVRCLTKLKNRMLHGRAITLAWAPGKGVKGKDLKDYWEGDSGVSYIPWSKIKPDIDLELLEDGGMIDEDAMPAWMKLKAASLSNNSSLTAEGAAGAYLQMAEGSTSGGVDTSQPPPVQGGGGLLQPPPMALPMVSPFQFNNRLLGAIGGMPPSMFQNRPIGVPPPSMQGAALMQNQLVGLGSPFQGAANLMSNLVQNSDNNNLNQQNENMKSLSETLLSMAQPFGLMPQPPVGLAAPDDNMDIEMEDAEKPERQPLLSEQLQASMGQFNNNNNQRVNPGGLGSELEMEMRRDKRMDRDRSSHSRERERERELRHRDRDRIRGMLRDPADFIIRDRDRKDDRRDRPNRWGDREFGELDRREREKTLNDRLQQMANEGVRPTNHDRLPPPPRERRDSDPGGAMPPSLMDRRLFPPLDGPPMGRDLEPPPYGPMGPPEEFERLPPPLDDPFLMDDYQMLDNPLMDNAMPMMDNPMMDCQDFPPRLVDVSPIHARMMHDDFEGERFLRGGRRDFRDRMRGPPGPDFFPGRDGFGPRPPPMRGAPDFPPIRGPMMRGLGPHKFHPRGGNIRGPRPAPPWNDRAGFGPRFDHPDFHRGPPGPPGLFDEPPHPRHRGRFEERRRSRSNDFPDFPPEANPPPEGDRFEKRSSRWGNNSPSRDEDNNQDPVIVIESGSEQQEQQQQQQQKEQENNEIEENKGGNTPLHDEPLTGDARDEGCAVEQAAPPPEVIHQEESAPSQPAVEVAE